MKNLDRGVKQVLRGIDLEKASQTERQTINKIKQALNEIRLDVRDYEYAENRAEQQKWSKIGQHNLKVLDILLMSLGDMIGPADMAEIGANTETLRDGLE